MKRIEIQRAPISERPNRWRILEFGRNQAWASYWRTARQARRVARTLRMATGGEQLGLVECCSCGYLGAFPCVAPWDASQQGYAWEEWEYLCGDCAEKQGYCRGCGYAWAGVESFEFSRIKGYCENCVFEIEADNHSGEDEEYYDPEDYDPAEPVSSESDLDVPTERSDW